MSENIRIREYQPEDYEQGIRLLYQLLNTITNPFNKMGLEKNIQFMKDIDHFPKTRVEGLYVLEDDDEIIGIMMLRFKEQLDYKGNSLSRWQLIKKYGLYKAFITNVVLSSLDTATEDDEVYLDYLVVSDKHRSKGYGTLLMNHGLEFCKLKNKKRYTLGVISSNTRAKALYERYGFKVIKESKFPKFITKRLGADGDFKMEIKVTE